LTSRINSGAGLSDTGFLFLRPESAFGMNPEACILDAFGQGKKIIYLGLTQYLHVECAETNLTLYLYSRIRVNSFYLYDQEFLHVVPATWFIRGINPKSKI